MPDQLFNQPLPTEYSAPPVAMPKAAPAAMAPMGMGHGNPLAPAGLQLKDGPAAPPPTTTPPPPPAYVPNTQSNYRPQDTVQMFSRLNPGVQAQVLAYMGFPPDKVREITNAILQNSGQLTIDNPSIVQMWQKLFGGTIDLNALGNAIFSDSVHAADADHNYHDYGAIRFNPGSGLTSTPESGQYGEPNHRGLRQLERPLEIAALLAGAAFAGPEIFGAFAGADAAGAAGAAAAGAGAETGLGAFAGIGDGLLDGGVSASFIGDLGEGAVDGLSASGLADSFTSGITDAVQNGFDTSTTPEGVLNPTLSPPPNVTVPPPNIPGASGGNGIIDGLTNSLTRDPLRTIGTGLSVANLIHNGGNNNGANTAIHNLQTNVNDNKPLGDGARDVLLHQGQPTDQQLSAINGSIDQQWKQGSEAIIQASVNSGQGTDSMLVQDKLRGFKSQLETQRQTLILKQADQNMLIALQELGLIDKEQFQLAQLELQSNQLSQQRASSIMQSLGWLWQQGSTRTNTNTNTNTNNGDTNTGDNGDTSVTG